MTRDTIAACLIGCANSGLGSSRTFHLWATGGWISTWCLEDTSSSVSAAVSVPNWLLAQVREQNDCPVLIWMSHISFSSGVSPPGEWLCCWIASQCLLEKRCRKGTLWKIVSCYSFHLCRDIVSAVQLQSHSSFSPNICFSSLLENSFHFAKCKNTPPTPSLRKGVKAVTQQENPSLHLPPASKNRRLPREWRLHNSASCFCCPRGEQGLEQQTLISPRPPVKRGSWILV